MAVIAIILMTLVGFFIGHRVGSEQTRHKMEGEVLARGGAVTRMICPREYPTFMLKYQDALDLLGWVAGFIDLPDRLTYIDRMAQEEIEVPIDHVYKEVVL